DLPPLETAAPTPVTRLEVWKRKLLDLSLRNRLLNFRDTQRAMQVLCPDLPAIEDALSDGERFTVHPRPVEFDEGWRAGEIHRQRTGDDLALELLRGEFAAHRLRTPLPPGELDRRLVQIYREARTSLEENGANTVYLALGFLSWRETKSSPENRYAPILLVPLEIERRSLQEGFSLRRGDDEPVVNTTLLQLLAKDHELRIPGLDPLPHDEHGVDVRAVMQRFRQAIRDIDGWEVIEAAFIGLFSFTKFLMWRDLEVRAEELQQNRVVRHLIRTPNEPFEETAWPDLERLDETHLPQATYCLLSADSSQLAAVYAAAAGRSFVLHGPPGTGKSQTITNLIAHALADGRTVLFVSEKAAALNVVHRRLVDCGLGPFCLELHSNKSHKIEVLRQFEEVLQFAAPRVPEEWAREAERLTALRRGLNHYVEALHRPRATGESLFAALTRLMELRGGPSPRIAWAAHGPWDAARLELLNATARELQETVQRQPHLADSPWQDVTTPTWSLAWREQVEEALGRLQLATAALAAAASELVALLQLPAGPWSMAGLGGLFDLSRAVLGAADLPPTLLDQDDWQLTAALLKQWITAGRHRDALRAALLARYRPEVLQLDAAVLQERLVETDQRWALVRNRGRKAVASELARCALDARALPDLVA
ncbi:MAG: DUF4011 domain-containing protein, partial [Armatimonadetes bacterium]|nr:DUF4011 domain-containing protein [Armatimonadota bacterium]